MRNLTVAAADRHPSDLYRTPRNVIEAWLRHYWPAAAGPYLVSDPCAGDGRIGEMVASAIRADELVLSDLRHYDHGGSAVYPSGTVVYASNALEWERPDFDGRVIVPFNPPFNQLDGVSRRHEGAEGILDRIWSQLAPSDEVDVLISAISLANNSRPQLWTQLGIMPFESIWDIRWRCPFETPAGETMKGAAMCHQWVRAVKGARVRPGDSRQYDLYRIPAVVPTAPELWWRDDCDDPVDVLDGGRYANGNMILKWRKYRWDSYTMPVVNDGHWLAPCVKPGRAGRHG